MSQVKPEYLFLSCSETHSEAEVVLVFVVNGVGKVLVAGLR